ncbi:hypothetical protein SAMN02745724_02499 [Pseudoalteromonas denitrificans DSM 6059]|uniref:Uncharacterized protein n=1 Tax=Pseudoalteromonas denitrificans DSM 6059 TaxID=1123010 RepID=A0A1I1LZ80_9GAMM|nr:hypothetical protein SAMN02745724_02499 [Pseudoalteromonas denitrificans DSM 6059]
MDGNPVNYVDPEGLNKYLWIGWFCAGYSGMSNWLAYNNIAVNQEDINKLIDSRNALYNEILSSVKDSSCSVENKSEALDILNKTDKLILNLEMKLSEKSNLLYSFPAAMLACMVVSHRASMK